MNWLKGQVKAKQQELVGKAKAAIKDALSEQQQQPPMCNPGAPVTSLQPLSHLGQGNFNHPGTLMGPAETTLLRQRAAGAAPTDAVWQAARAALAADTPLSYQPHPLRDILVEWFDGPKQGHDELVEKDGKMVYMQAVMWLVSGDERYARNAACIIDAWATTNKSIAGKNGPLESGWGVASMARSAELLKYTWPGWPADLEARFVAWVSRLVLPQLNHEILERLPQANWQATVAECKAALAVLTGNRALWDNALSMWHRVFNAYIKPCGECGETSRDLFHSQFGLGGLVQLAEMAWQQGQDLYSTDNNRLLTALELHAFITNGGKPSQCCYELKGIGFLPCGWEVAYNHYVGRCGLAMPETAKMLAKSRPEKYVFHWGLGTLTHYGSAQALRGQQLLPS